MVSGSLCPLISFLDMSYIDSFVVSGSGPIGDEDHYLGGSLGLKRVFRDGRASEAAGRASKQLGGPQSSWEGLRASREGLGFNWKGLRAS